MLFKKVGKIVRNLVLIHLESLNIANYRVNRKLYPILQKWEEQSISFSKYYATATSTMMICSDLAYGGILQYEPCERLNGNLDKYCYKESLFDELKEEGYQLKVVGYPQDDSGDIIGGNRNYFIGYKTEMEVIESYEQYLQAIENTLTQETPFAVWACNYINNVSYNCFMENARQQNGLERWERAYRCMDSCAGDIMDMLEKKGLLERTTVLFYGDHGDDVFSHGKHAGLLHAIEPYETLIHTPFWIYDSRFESAEVDSLIDTTDIRGIIRQLLNLPEQNLERNVLQLSFREYSLARNTYAAQKVREKSFHKAYSLTDGRFLFLTGDQGMELYHIVTDTGCQHNLLDYFDLRNGVLELNHIAYGRLKYHFHSLIDESVLAKITQIFYEYRRQLFLEVKKIYEYAECDALSLEIDFNNIHYGWEERQMQYRENESGTAHPENYEEFETYDRYLEGKRILLYGAGNYGKYFYKRLASRVEIVAWVDRNYKEISHVLDKEIQSPEHIGEMIFDIVFIAVSDSRIKEEIKTELMKKSIPAERIY